MVLRVALGCQPVPLDRVGEDHAGTRVVDGAQRRVQRPQVVAAQVPERGHQRVVGEVGDQRADRVGVRAAGQARTQLAGGQPQ